MSPFYLASVVFPLTCRIPFSEKEFLRMDKTGDILHNIPVQINHDKIRGNISAGKLYRVSLFGPAWSEYWPRIKGNETGHIETSVISACPWKFLLRIRTSLLSVDSRIQITSCRMRLQKHGCWSPVWQLINRNILLRAIFVLTVCWKESGNKKREIRVKAKKKRITRCRARPMRSNT